MTSDTVIRLIAEIIIGLEGPITKMLALSLLVDPETLEEARARVSREGGR